MVGADTPHLRSLRVLAVCPRSSASWQPGYQFVIDVTETVQPADGAFALESSMRFFCRVRFFSASIRLRLRRPARESLSQTLPRRSTLTCSGQLSLLYEFTGEIPSQYPPAHTSFIEAEENKLS